MRNKVLIVDDSLFNRKVLIDVLQSKYEILEAVNGREAFQIIEEKGKEIAAVLLDIVMPEVDGLMLLDMLNKNQRMGEFPVLMVTGEQNFDILTQCFNLGASDFIRKPVHKDFVMERVEKLVDLFIQKNEFKDRLERQTQTLRNQYKLLQEQAEQLKKSNENIIEVLGTIVEYRNMENRNHIKRVSSFTEILGRHMMENYPEYNLTAGKVQMIAQASVLHDVGKIMIRDEVLLKPGHLTENEQEYLKSHTLRGFEIISSITEHWDNKDYVQCCQEIARSHHERYDGGGYPDELKGDEIPISAQLVSLADCFERLIYDNINESAVSYEEAYHMILQGERGCFSPKLLDCLRKSREELTDCAVEYEDEEDAVG